MLVASRTRAGRALTQRRSGFAGKTWLVTGAAESAIAKVVDHVVVATPGDRGELLPHGDTPCCRRGPACRATTSSLPPAEVFRGPLPGSRSACPSTNASSWSAPGAAPLTALEAVLKSARARTPPPRRTTRNSAPWPSRGDRLRVRSSCSRARGGRPSAVDATRALGQPAAMRSWRRPRSGRRHRPLPAPDARSRGCPRHRPGHDPLGPGSCGTVHGRPKDLHGPPISSR